MILKALYDYYDRCGNLPAPGMEEKEIGFIVVLAREGKFVRFEDCRIDKSSANTYLVKKHVGRSSAPVANYLYDNCAYVLGFCNLEKVKETDKEKEEAKTKICFETFVEKIHEISSAFPDNADINAIKQFYEAGREAIFEQVSQDALWGDIVKNLSKKYSTFSFRIEGDTKIVAEKRELLQLEVADEDDSPKEICIITGKNGVAVDTTTATMIPGSQATAKLVSFQVNSGYDSYGKSKCFNAPISVEAEFAYTTALNALLQKGSRNKFILGSRTFVFWASSNSEAAQEIEDSFADFLGISDEVKDDPNANIEKVRRVFTGIYSGAISSTFEDKFYILGLAPNSARIAVVYWSETTLKDFAGKILQHFDDMEIVDNRKDQKPYHGLNSLLSAVTLGGKPSDATPNLPEAVVKSIFQGLPYPFSLYSSCIRRIRAEQKLTITRVAILKAYLNRINNNQEITAMLDKENKNIGYLCGRLFAVLENLQYAANGQDSIRSSYMNAASSTPSAVFPTILKLSNTHYGKLAKDKKGLAIFFDSQKQDIMSMLPDFPDTLELGDQGRFFIGYYHQKNNKEDKNNNNE